VQQLPPLLGGREPYVVQHQLLKRQHIASSTASTRTTSRPRHIQHSSSTTGVVKRRRAWLHSAWAVQHVAVQRGVECHLAGAATQAAAAAANGAPQEGWRGCRAGHTTAAAVAVPQLALPQLLKLLHTRTAAKPQQLVLAWLLFLNVCRLRQQVGRQHAVRQAQAQLQGAGRAAGQHDTGRVSAHGRR
jgi:hypothetical protein